MSWRSGSTSEPGRPSRTTPLRVDGWLVRDERVLASAEVALGRLAKARGLLGRTGIEGAFVLQGRHSVHSFNMDFDLDVAFLRADGTVIKTLRLCRNRVTLPVWHARWIVEAEAGAFAAWELKVGDVIDIRTVDDHPGPPAGPSTGPRAGGGS